MGGPTPLTALVVAVPVSAGDLIANGIDLWTTPGHGGTFVNFAADPIPAGQRTSYASPPAPSWRHPAGIRKGVDLPRRRPREQLFWWV